MALNDTPLPKMKIEEIFEHGSRDECLEALRELRNLSEQDVSPRLVDLLIGNLGHRFWLIRREISNTLVRLGESVVDHLIPWTTSNDDDICYWSLKTLSLFPARAMPHIESLLDHEMAVYADALGDGQRRVAAIAVAPTRLHESAGLILDQYRDRAPQEIWGGHKVGVEDGYELALGAL